MQSHGITLVPTFDWYQFSTQTGVRELLEVLGPIEAEVEPFHEETPKLKGYGWAKKLGGPGGSVLIHYGGRNGDEYGPNVAGTGPLAPTVAALVRQAAVPHGVGRSDVRCDFLGDFDACRRLFIDRCNQAGMATADAGSCPESTTQLGRTVYGGARSSMYRPTLYQKGLQLGPDYPANYLRLEHRYAPTKSHEKAQLSTLEPAQMIGLRPVARDLTASIAQIAIDSYKLTKYPTERSAYQWMLRQYRGTFETLLQDHGSPAAVGCQLYLDLAEMAETDAA